MAFESGNIPKETLEYLASRKAESSKSAGPFLAIAFLICVGIAAIVFFGDSSKDTAAKQDSSAAKDQAKVAVPYKPDVLIAAAKGHMAAKEFQAALDEIGDLNADDSNRPAVQGMFTRATREVKLANLTKERSARVAYAKEYEQEMLEAGGDYTVRAQGPNADILSVTFVLINRPFVYKTENDSDLNATFTLLGFKSVRLSDGFDNSWSYKLHSE